ncbi:actin cytoskeleton and mitosis protein, partial [Coemansia nantahalensis]
MQFHRPAAEEERLKALRRERFRNTEGEARYRQLVAERAARRKQLEEQGVLSRQGALAEATKILGTCTLMCPVFEREERELKNNIAPQEQAAGTRRADPARTVKTFHRSAAGNEEPLPEDLRTAETLLRTLDHLVGVVIAEDPTLQSCHGFVRDRTRSIRQDFTIQNIRDWTTVAACERIARFHIVSLHVLCGHKDFAEQQDMEQLRNTLKTLIELYDDHRRAGQRCANEAEFYAYYIVSHLRDSDAKRVAERLPAHIFTAPVVQQALRLHMLSESSGAVSTRRDPGSQFGAQNLATQFFRAVASPDTPLLLACLAEYRFPSIRRAALKAMCDAFPYQEGKEYPAEDFAAMLAFDSADEVREFCALFSVACNDRGVKIGERTAGALVYREPDQRPQRMRPNLRAVGAKFRVSPMQAIDGSLDPRLLGPSSLVLAAAGRANVPLPRINWAALTNALYDSLIGSAVRETALPVARRFGRWASAGDALAGDICQSIVDYTSAFVVYEEAYRCVLLAQADGFRTRALLRSAFARWNMESVARQQDRARQLQLQDDLDDILDREYTSLRYGPLVDPDDVFGDAAPPPQHNQSTASAIAPAPAVPDGFWESAHLGADCFEAVHRALVRFGGPSFRIAVDVTGTHGAAVLPSWLWWQVDPSSIGAAGSAGLRVASYERGAQALVFRERAEDGPTDADASMLSARVVVLHPEPASAADIGSALGDGIVSRVRAALDWARSRTVHSGGGGGGGGGGGDALTPLLFVFWSGERRAAKAVRRLVEQAIGASGLPSHVATNVLAVNLDASKQQLAAGLQWMCRLLVQARKSSLVRTARAYVLVATAQQHQLQRMRDCVASVARGSPLDDEARAAIFNMAADIANTFAELINRHLLTHTRQRA